MEFEIVYPVPRKRSLFMNRLRFICGWIFIAACIVCLVVNYSVGGKCWCPIVIWSEYMIWTILLNQPMVERNIIRIGTRFLLMSLVLMLLIELLLAPGWAHIVMPIFCFGSLIVLGVVFFINVYNKRYNIALVWVLLITLSGSGTALLVYSDTSWPVIVLCSVSAALLIASVVVLRLRLLRELRKRFHIR